MTAEHWNKFWTKALADGAQLATDRVRSPPSAALAAMKPEWTSVLVVGNGLSTEPFAFARAGYACTAIDVSDVAIAYLVAHPATEDELRRWGGRVREGGSLELVCAAVATYEPGRAFDVVMCPYAWQCLTTAERERVLSWVKPGGVCHSTS